jgi:hypothetical protein
MKQVVTPSPPWCGGLLSRMENTCDSIDGGENYYVCCVLRSACIATG